MPVPALLSLRSSTTSSNESRLSQAATVVNDGVDDAKGYLGLNLLHCPAEPRVDFVFVHGLGGGSRKSWSKTASISHFWPQEWLPKDPAFKHVRIHTYGYNSDWAKGKENCLNVHHFGKSLLGELAVSPRMANANTPIVLIGHSMGGLVIKKAYLLSRQDEGLSALAERIHSIYFLATPHRGSDSAKVLRNVLQMANSGRAYVDDLDRNSEVIRAINDEFPNHSSHVKLWSFYETQKLTMGMMSRLIVDPDSAVLGYKEERQIPMNADHRSICKFDTPTDPNYIMLRNALSTTVDDILKKQATLKVAASGVQIKGIKKYLGISSTYEDDLMAVEDARMTGTCQWFTKKNAYLAWADMASGAQDILWVSGKPAAGKTVLSGFIIDHLRGLNRPCSYFFFKYGERTKSRLGAALRHLAFQMAQSHTSIRDRISTMQEHGVQLDDGNDASLWRKLFVDGIFQTQFSTHYWVLDAMDECLNYSLFFESMLAKLDPSIPLKILITSRDTPELHNLFTSLGDRRMASQRISTTDTFQDIHQLVEERSRCFNVQSNEYRMSLVQKILDKAQGSFLWTILVLSELSSTYSEEEINTVLDEIPPEMGELYLRTLQAMSRLPRGKTLAKAILTWTTCASRPLTLAELDGAIRLDLNENITKLDETIAALCGQLVMVDKSGRVQMIHQTAREFLVDEKLDSEFRISTAAAHTRLAKACLSYLVSDEMKPPRTNRRGSNVYSPGMRADFSAYACTSFSYHLARATPSADDILPLVDRFLKANVLTWIEGIARGGDLVPLVRTAKLLNRYAEKIVAELSPLDKSVQCIRGWATDLVRLSAKFAAALIDFPPGIFSLIPPLCPSESEIYKACSVGRKLSVTGLSTNQWDDRLSCVAFRHGQASALCHGHEFFAVGLTTGKVALYHANTCQEYKTLDHGESVRLLGFKYRPNLLATCGMKTLKIWDVQTGQALYTLDAPQRPVTLDFVDQFLLVATSKGYLATWDLTDQASRHADRPWGDEDVSNPLKGQPSAISISIPHKMLAVAYNGRPIILWDLESDSFYGYTGKRLPSGDISTHPITALAFNPKQDLELLAASYLDGELVILDPFNDQELESCRAQCPTLAVSPDGRFLAGAPGGGVLHIYEFDTLRLLYRVQADSMYIKQISFSQDSLRLADIRGSQCHVWEPVALWRDTLSDESSVDNLSTTISAVVADSKSKITATCVPLTGGVAFVGKADGSLSLYDLRTGVQTRELYRHKSPVRIISWSATRQVLLSVDVSNETISWKLQKSLREGWIALMQLFQSRLDCGHSIHQALLSDNDERLILSTRGSDHLWTQDGTPVCQQDMTSNPTTRKWFQHPSSAAHVVCFDGDSSDARICLWKDLDVVSSFCVPSDLQCENVMPWGRRFVCPGEARMCVLDQSLFDLAGPDHAKPGPGSYDLPSVAQTAAISKLAAHVLAVVSAGNGKLVFLDTRSWVCSADIDALLSAESGQPWSYSRHFFVPTEWFAGSRDIICSITGTGRDIVFARDSDLVVIKGGLDFAEKVEMNVSSGKRHERRGLLTVPERSYTDRPFQRGTKLDGSGSKMCASRPAY